MSTVRRPAVGIKSRDRNGLARTAGVGLGGGINSSKLPKKKIVYQFGDFRFDFIKQCKHDLRENANPHFCPLCRLVNMSVAQHFRDDEASKLQAQKMSIDNRIILRYNLLDSWAHNQADYYSDFVIGHTVDVSMCKSLMEAIIGISDDNVSTDKFNYSELTRLLDRRRRIQEIGLYAITYLQTRIRKYCILKKAKRMLIRRFEYIPENKFRGDFWLDSVTHRKWHRYPHIIKHERPSTPKTIGRRLNHQETRRANNLKRFEQAVSNRGDLNPWDHESKYIVRLRQFALCKDVLAVAFKIIQEEALIMKERKLSSQQVYGQQPKKQSKSSQRSGPSKGASNLDDDNVAVRISISAPAPSSYQLGTSLTLLSPAMDPIGLSTTVSSDQRVSPTQPNNTGNGAEGTSEPYEILDSYNTRLRELDMRAYENLHCVTVDEAIEILLCDDIQPSLASVLHIALDEYGIWNSSRDCRDSSTTNKTKTATGSSNNNNNNNSNSNIAMGNSQRISNSDKDEQVHINLNGDILPISIRLRPYNPANQPNGFFRLFFFEEELVAATQVSPWTYYVEVHQNREGITNLIKNYANSIAMRNFVRKYMAKASDVAEDTDTMASAPYSSNYSSSAALKKIENLNGRCDSLCIPSDKEVFQLASTDNLAAADLTDEEVVKLHRDGQYKFLQRLSIWKDRLKRAQAAMIRRKPKLAAANSVAGTPTIGEGDKDNKSSLNSVTSATSANTRRKFPSMDPADLVGNSIYDFCVVKMQQHAKSKSNASDTAGSSISYYQKLEEMVNGTDMSILDRIQHDVKGPTGAVLNPTGPKNDLLVVDIAMNIPLPQGFRSAKTFANGDTSNDPSIRSNHIRMSTKELEKLVIEVHEVVGLFSTRTARPPPNLDLPLLSWEFFQQLRLKADKETLTIPPESAKNIPNLGTWTRPNDDTGLITQRSMTSTGLLFTMRLLGSNPSRDYLEEAIPRKTKNWLGLS